MIDDDSGGGGVELECSACWDVIEQVADEIDRASEHGLCAVAVVCGIDAPVLIDADVVGAAVGFNEVVVGEVDVVVVDVDRRSATVRVGFRRTVGGDADGVVEIGDGVVGDDVAGAVNFDGEEAAELVRGVDTGGARVDLIPTDDTHLVFAAEEEIVGDEEVAGAGVFRPDADADVFEAAVADGKGDCAHHFFFSGEECNIGVAEGEAFKDVMLGCHHVEELVVACAVEDGFAVASAFDGDGFVGGAFEGERHRAGEGGA